jgi:repressor LexA
MAPRCLPEECPAQPLVKRSRIRNQEQLAHTGHISKATSPAMPVQPGIYAAAVFMIDLEHTHDTVLIYSMNGLTRKQQQILDFIQKWQRTEGATPTFREIADRFGFRSLNSVTEHVRLLRQKGVLVTEPGKARSLRVISPLTKLRGRVVDIPLFGSIPAGMPQAREQEAEGCVSVDIVSIGFKPTRNSFALRVTGDSMIGRHILAGDVVVLEHGPEPRNGQVVAALIDGESTLKTFVLKGAKPYLRAENPKYPDLIPAQELMIQGVFKALIRKALE